MSTEGQHTGRNLGRDLSGAVVLFHQAAAARVGLSAGDLKTLELIAAEGPFSASELARRIGLTAAGATSVIARLAAGGFVVREIDPRDRRRAIVRAADGERPELAEAFARLGQALGGVIAEYDTAEQAAILSYLSRMIDVLREQTLQFGSDAR
ncbi:MarR family transcriptional regulator [Actinoplanes oblitus]|uniref:MarR family transcriptional regulator n=1 Tax=Actinoplanes oblitus TaxID=3040509 RepID=A0ABY8WR00_9ACTN|nr:MarR family transcriptional regulator [Actinoplanes oblitus]WIN00286.1 MarR family transcriptional regulator [Actinoplanes oblitus]